MEKELNEKIEVPESLLSIYREIAVSPVDLLKNYASSVIKEKINKYKDENRRLMSKYGCSFEQLKARVEAVENEENFEWEDDLLDWEFAIANIDFWRRKARSANLK
jgi:hypothetical protein